MNTCDFRMILWEALSYEGRESLLAEMQTRYVEDIARHIQKEKHLEKRLEWYRKRCSELASDNEYLISKLGKFEQIKRIIEE